MAERLEGKRKALLAETEERIGLERQLRSAEKFAALGRLSGGLAHELGSPLSAIEVRAEAVEADPTAPPGTRRHAREIVAEVERIAGLMSGLRHVSRRHPLEARPTDLVEVARLAAGDVAERAAAAGVVLAVEPAEPVPIEGDVTLLRHAVANLALNAVQALEGHAGERRLTIYVDRDDGTGRIALEDNGPGLAPEVRKRLFEPFLTTRDTGEGTGLGLAISLGIAEEHGGDLRIESRSEGGTRAVLRVPLRDASGKAP
jgi:signal transduction histidine kinase